MTTAPAPKPWIMGIAPYVPGRATSEDGRTVVKLSSNENPFGTPEAARAAYRAAADHLERYPDAAAVALRTALAAHYGVEADRLVYGTGSDEVLHLAAGTFAGPGDEIIHVRYGFAVYDIATRRVGATPVVVADRDYATDVDAILAAVTERTKVVFVANPNNPTGTHTARDDIARLHAGLPASVLLVIDQAYTEYLDPADDDGALELARTAPNVLVTRTFSKIFGLASERVGWGYAAPAIIDAMHRIRAPFAFGIGAQAAAIAALGDADFVAHSREHNRTWRAWFSEQADALPGLRAVPSKANFVLVLFEGTLTAAAAYTALMAAGYATRWLPGQGLPHGLRITIGTEAEIRAVVDVLRAEVEHRLMLPFARVAIIGLGLIGSSIARAVRERMPTVRLTGHDADAGVRAVAREIALLDDVADTAGAAVTDADLVILCVPVGAMEAVAGEIAAELPDDAIVSDVGSCKGAVARALAAALPPARVVPAHPVAGTEQSGPRAGFATLFRKRWCIVTPLPESDPAAVLRVEEFWRRLGADVERMAPDHHDLVLAVTSHLPHLIAYTIVGTADDLQQVTQSEVIKFSAGGFRDFTRIAASDPTMWRDVFLSNKDAVLEMLQRFSEDLSQLQRAIRWDDGDALFDRFAKTRAIRRSIVDQGQDDPAADFGRRHD